jgi:uncharacterized protein (DUF362 family)
MKSPIDDVSLALERHPGPGGPSYPPEAAAPYAPSEAYPEFPALAPGAGTPPNPVFGMVRGVLAGLGLDAGRFGTPEWNPLGDFVGPGAKIAVKPNWVLHRNENPAGSMDCMVTHPSVLRAVLEYVFLAKPSLVTLGDAPLQGCDFGALLDYAGMRAVIGEFRARGLPLAVTDYRRTTMHQEGLLKTGVSENRRPESEYVLVDLGGDSLLEEISRDWKKFRVTVYDPRKMWPHHSPGRHRYLVAREIMEADLVVNCPKLKTHKKAGVTCCLKNLVGINGNKEYLPHHRKGAADNGSGDNYSRAHWKMSLAEDLLDFANEHLRGMPRAYRLAERIAWRFMVKHRKADPEAQLEGSWHGNDTIWRTCLDLNRALLYAGLDGRLRDEPQRQVLSIVDAVIAGQGTGPLEPEPLPTGAIFATRNPAAGDLLACSLLGFRAESIRLVDRAFGSMRWPIASARPDLSRWPAGSFPAARAPAGWEGHVELGME